MPVWRKTGLKFFIFGLFRASKASNVHYLGLYTYTNLDGLFSASLAKKNFRKNLNLKFFKISELLMPNSLNFYEFVYSSIITRPKEKTLT